MAGATRDDIRRWRMKAEELRATAELANDPTARRGLLNAARTYESMANTAEGFYSGSPAKVSPTG